MEGPPLKKVKLSEDAGQASIALNSDQFSQLNTAEKVDRILQTDGALGSLSHAAIFEAASLWAQCLDTESDSQLLSLILTHLARWVSRFDFLDASAFVKKAIDLDRRRPKIKLQVLLALLCVAKAKQDVREHVVAWTQAQLFYGPQKDRHIFVPPRELDPRVKVAALLAVSELLRPKFAVAALQTQDLCAEFLHDSDARVRRAAIEALLQMHNQDFKVDIKHYQAAVTALTDDDESVRLAAVKLLWALANTYQTQNVASVQQHRNRVIPVPDDAFLKICSVATDIVVEVRQEACKLLGTLEAVSLPLLQQALSKKLVKVDLVPNPQQHAQKMKYSTVEGEPDDVAAPGEVVVVVASSAAALIESGSYGALIHALEDEFAEVRCAAVETIAALSLRSQEFALQSVEFLVDMFNDENEQVRITTVQSLEKFGHRIKLAFPQVQHLLALLGDQSAPLRQAVRSLLSNEAQQLPDVQALIVSVNTLLHNMLIYPLDSMSVMHALQKLGRSHPEFVQLGLERLLPELVHHHTQHIDELEYQAVLILVFNAVAKRLSMLSLLPPHMRHHYLILRDRYPIFLPRIDPLESGSEAQIVPEQLAAPSPLDDEPINAPADVHSRAGLLIELSECSKAVEQAIRLSKLAISDPSMEKDALYLYANVESRLQRLTVLAHHRSMAASETPAAAPEPFEELEALPFAMWHVMDILRDILGISIAVLSGSDQIFDWTQKIIRKAYEMETVFVGVPPALKTLLFRWRIHAHLVYILDLLIRSKNRIPPLELDTAIAAIQCRVRNDHNALPANVADLVRNINVDADAKIPALDALLSHRNPSWSILAWPFASAQVDGNVGEEWKQMRRCHAHIASPSTNPHHPIEFIGGLPFELKIVGHLVNVTDRKRFKLKTRSISGVTSILEPNSLNQDDNGKDKFEHSLLVQEKTWPAGSSMELDAVLLIDTDLSADCGPFLGWEAATTHISVLHGDAIKIFASASRRSF